MSDVAAPAAAPAVSPQSPASSEPGGQQASAQAGKVENGKSPKEFSQPSTLIRKMKVDGKEIEVNLSDDKQLEQILRDAGLGKAAFDRMREAAELKKEISSVWESIEKNPQSIFEILKNPRLKLSPEQRRDIIEKFYHQEYMEQDKLTPEQKKIAELEKWKAEKEAAEKKVEEDRKASEKRTKEEKLNSEWRETYQKQIIDALEKGKLPKTPRTAARVAMYMAQAVENGFEAPLETVVGQVQKDYEEELKTIFADEVPIEAVLKLLPPNLVKRIRKYDLDQYRAKQAKLNQPAVSEETPKEGVRRKREERPTYASVLRRFGS